MLQTLPPSIRTRWPSLVAGLMGLALLAGSCSSPTAPLSDLASSPLSFSKGKLIVSGNTMLTAAGQTTQLSVADASGAQVTSGVQWQSLAVGTASVSASGLVTASNPGTAVIQAVTSTAQGSLTVFVTSPNALAGTPKSLAACNTGIAAGSYVLAGDLTGLGTSTPCLTLSNLASLQIDCQGHVLPGLTLNNVGAATISNCAITRATNLNNASSITIATSSFTSAVVVTGSSNVTISDSSMTVSAFYVFQALRSTGVRLLRDTITATAASASAAVLFQNGSNNQVVQSTMVGKYNGGPLYNGTDDGILDIDEVGDAFQGNTITNFFDTAVEGVDLVANLTVSDNTFSNIGVTGISSYWCTNWTNSVFRNNTVSTSPMLLYTDYSTGLGQCGATSIAGGFSNNQIIGNRFQNPTPNALVQVGAVEVPGGRLRATGAVPRLIVAMGGVVTNNLIQGNDFGTSDGPFLSPLSGFIDGGGNVCGPLNPALSNFVCTGHSSTSALIRR